MADDANATMFGSSKLVPSSSTRHKFPRDAARTSASYPASTFECFSRLPEELRMMIWDAAMASREPRIVDLCQFRPKHLRENTTCSTFERTLFSYGTLSKPAIVDVSREARRAGQHHYCLEFGAKHSDSKGLSTIEGPPFVWVDWSRDIFLPTPPYYNENALLRDLCHKETRRIALSISMVATFSPTFVEYYPCLSEIIVYEGLFNPYGFHAQYFDPARSTHFELIPLSENLEDELAASVTDSETRRRYLGARQDIMYQNLKRKTMSQGSKREAIQVSFAHLRITEKHSSRTAFTIQAKGDSVT
ncbi:uncharacterized protein PAC_10036 [Phialocephala subalpina]|uniref:2EXR domain-containing protein n=1 Tax=Phialocephala subalpina TaxID=576137 RepID=A0A1L7X536_9HELO|nr:uncharacterized protein PAC_10036 [Phialocephala subalpina]